MIMFCLVGHKKELIFCQQCDNPDKIIERYLQRMPLLAFNKRFRYS